MRFPFIAKIQFISAGDTSKQTRRKRIMMCSSIQRLEITRRQQYKIQAEMIKHTEVRVRIESGNTKHQKHRRIDPSSVLDRVHQRLMPDAVSTTDGRTVMSCLGDSLSDTHLVESNKKDKNYLRSNKHETPHLGSNQSGLFHLELKQSNNSPLEPNQWNIPHLSANSTNIPHLRSNQSDIPNQGSDHHNTIHLGLNQSNIPQLASNQTNIPHLESNQTNIPHLESSQTNIPHLESNQTNIPHLESSQVNIPHLESNQTNIPPHLEFNQTNICQPIRTLINTHHLRTIHLGRSHAKNCQLVLPHKRASQTHADDRLHAHNPVADASPTLKPQFGNKSCSQRSNETPVHRMQIPTFQEGGLSSASSGTPLKVHQDVQNKWLVLAVVVLALGVIHLHFRLIGLEQVDRWPTVECPCQQGKINLGVEQHAGHKRSIDSKIEDKDLDRNIRSFPADKDNSERSSSDASDFAQLARLSLENTKRLQKSNQEQNGDIAPTAKVTVSDMVQFGKNTRASKERQDISETPIQNKANSSTGLTREVGHSSKLLAMLTKSPPNDPVQTKPHILLRFNRSAKAEKRNKGKSGNSKSGKDKSKHKGGQNAKTEHQDKADDFDVPFDQQINHTQYFTRESLDATGNCAPVPMWGSGVKACRDTTVKFQHPNSVLPFFQYTQKTLVKTKRNIELANMTGGFQAVQAGYYMVHLNMTLVYEETEQDTYYRDHYLTLFLNGQAMFSCRDNRFRCPHMNHKSSSKYMVCNILGMLQLREADVVDLRTVGANLAVRTRTKHRHSYLTFIQIQKSR